MTRHGDYIPRSLLVLGAAVLAAVAVLLALITAPMLGGRWGGTALAGTRCSGGSGQASPTPTPTESEDPGPVPTEVPSDLPVPIPGETESPSPTPSPTSGGEERCRSEIGIRYDLERTRFSGGVRSDKAACERGRRVILKLDRSSGKDRTVGTTTTNRRGKWAITHVGRGKRYYAKTPRQTVVSAGQDVICLGDRSPSIRA